MGIPGSLSESEVTLAAAKPDTDWSSLLEVHMQKTLHEDDMTDADMLNGYGDIDLLEQLQLSENQESQVDSVTEITVGAFGGKMSALKSVNQEEALEEKPIIDFTPVTVNAADIDDYRKAYAEMKEYSKTAPVVEDGSGRQFGEETKMPYSKFLVNLATAQPEKEFRSLIATAKALEGATELEAISFAKTEVERIRDGIKVKKTHFKHREAAAATAAAPAAPDKYNSFKKQEATFQRPTWWPQSVPWHPPARPQKVYTPKGNHPRKSEDTEEVKLKRWQFAQ